MFGIDFGAVAQSLWDGTLGAAWAFMLSWPWWVWVCVGAVPMSVNLAILARVKQLFGWQAMAAVLMVEWTAFVYVMAYVRGKQNMAFNPFDRDGPADSFGPVVIPERRSLPTFKDLFGKPSKRRTYNHNTGMWESISNG